jgi:hypothetical protein
MDEVTKDIQGDIPWCMVFADDVVMVFKVSRRFKALGGGGGLNT